MVSPQFSYCPSGNDNHDVETTTPGLGMYGITTVQLLSVRKRPPRHGNHNSGSWYVWYHHSSVTVRPVTTTTDVETTTPGLGMYGITTVQLLSVRKRPPRHGNHNSGSWYVWYHHSSVTVRPVTTTTAWGNHNSGSWYVWYHHSSVTVRPVTTTTTWKPQLRALVCMVSPQFSYCPSGNDNHDMETTTPGLGMYGITTVQLLSVRKRLPLREETTTPGLGMYGITAVQLLSVR